MRPAIIALCVLVGAAQAFAEAPATAEAPAAAAPDAAAPDAAAPESEAKPLPLPVESSEASDDEKAPLIEDVAVAASSPNTAPMVTAVITDDWSGVERAHVYFRPLGEPAFMKAALNPGTGGLFIARLPDGTQKRGFEYYVEVWDAANNGPSRMGSPEEPYRIEPAAEGTVTRLEREQEAAAMGPVHPAWMMLSLGGGVLMAAGSGIFWLDLVNLQGQLASETDPERRVELDDAILGDIVLGSVLGVVAAAGLATGISLLVYSALEE